MSHARHELLLESLAEVLETSAFISLSPAEETLPAMNTALVVSMEIGSGCKIHIAAASQLAAAVAANVLMLEPGSPEADERAHDALKEILNITAGLYLSRAPWLQGGIPEMRIPNASTLEGTEPFNNWVKTTEAQLALAEELPIAIAIEGRI